MSKEIALGIMKAMNGIGDALQGKEKKSEEKKSDDVSGLLNELTSGKKIELSASEQTPENLGTLTPEENKIV